MTIHLTMLTDHMWPAVQDLTEGDTSLKFQHHGAQPHYSITVRNWLDDHFTGKWIGCRAPIDWPVRSPDITVPNAISWGVLKGKV